MDYGFPWDHLITAFKFHGQADLAGPLAQVLAQVLAQALAPAAAVNPALPCTLVLPVPLSAARLASRGYNQAWELARRLAAAQALPARADLLLRAIDTAHQVDLGRTQRQHNLRAAFYVEPRLRPALAGQRVALVDDVMTTGSTAVEASRALLRAGAAAVHVWVLARTPQASSTTSATDH